MVKNPPAMRETWGRSLDWEDPLEEGMATHSSILAWRIPIDRGAWQARVHGSQSWTRLRDKAQHRAELVNNVVVLRNSATHVYIHFPPSPSLIQAGT